MTPQVIHRYAFATKAAVEALFGKAADCEHWEIKLDGDQVVVDIVPWEVTSSIDVPAEGIDHEKLAAAIENGDFRPDQQDDPAPPELAADPDDTVADEPAEPKGGPLAASAGIICNEGAFWLWASEEFYVEVRSAKDARELILNRCGITSRKYLDHDQEAAEIFRAMRRNYQFWMQSPE